ncbi:TetR/AcrR family transcriptional regulator [Amycolatopsis sp.]|jgi:AcrR family transcriptional regulator|uniref:TetR/AcrR family transcriptional regulator n=1 Tax=Amycolatopsis sp. TaxID=37632 RepID=UPI002E0C1EAA|nr:TetR/AcrR family transcriptional regulator [Amycolatopsis sp.]
MGTREKILAAAAEIMTEQGYARATTKEIARVAGYSEATLYKHFRDKTELFVAVIGEELPQVSRAGLIEQAGTGTVRDHLIRFTRTALDFYTASFPIAVSVFSSRELLEAHRTAMRERGAGPRHPVDGLIDYLRAEQHLDRIRAETDVEAMAFLLLGACFQQAFLINFSGEKPSDLDALSVGLVRTLLTEV